MTISTVETQNRPSMAPCRCRCKDTLRAAERELEALREQNRLLHDSAVFFADLSERLNARLRMQKAAARQ